MPLYTNAFPPKSIAPGDSEKVWNAEVVVAGGVGAISASARVALVENSVGDGTPFSAFIQFSAAPGGWGVAVIW